MPRPKGPLFTEDLPDGGEVNEIVIWGWGSQTGSGTSGGGQFNGYTDTTWLDPDLPEDLPCTPPPDGRAPKGVDMDDVRSRANEIKKTIEDLGGPGRRWEYGGLIYRAAGGSIHASGLYTSLSADEISVSIDIPTGSTVLAWVHSHPTMRHAEQGQMSEDDVASRNDFVATAGRLADPNMMMYVIDRKHDDRMNEFGMEDGEGDTGVTVGPCAG